MSNEKLGAEQGRERKPKREKCGHYVMYTIGKWKLLVKWVPESRGKR